MGWWRIEIIFCHIFLVAIFYDISIEDLWEGFGVGEMLQCSMTGYLGIKTVLLFVNKTFTEIMGDWNLSNVKLDKW